MIALLFSLMLGCGGGKAKVECDAETPCGWGESCVAGQCETGRCNTSAECPMEQHCEESACVAGCERDADCFPGDQCEAETGVCTPKACESTEVDCGFREFCDPSSGDCFDAGSLYCKPCTDDIDCGEGNVCYARGCGVDCTQSDCPNGFDCIPIVDNLGEIETYQCITYCWIYDPSWQGMTAAPAAVGPLPSRLVRTPEGLRAQ